MPPVHIYLTTLLLLLPPLYGIAIILLDNRAPHCRSVLALGGGLLLNAAILLGLNLISLLFEGQSPLALLIPAIVAISAARLMQAENAC